MSVRVESDNPTNSYVAKILVVCTANRGRSPIAEAMLQQMLQERELAHVIGVESAGMCVYELGRIGFAVSDLVAKVGAAHGLDLSKHTAKPLEAQKVPEFDLIIVMEDWQKQALDVTFVSGKVFSLRQLAGQLGDPNTPDVAGVPEESLEVYIGEAQRCLRAAFTHGPLAELVERVCGVARSRPREANAH